MNALKDLVICLFSTSPTNQVDLMPAPPPSTHPSQVAVTAESERETPRSRHRTETPRTKVEAWRKQTIPPPFSRSESTPISTRTRKRCSGHVEDSLEEIDSIRSRKRSRMDITQYEFDRLSITSHSTQADVPMTSIERTVSPASSTSDGLSVRDPSCELELEGWSCDYGASRWGPETEEDNVEEEDETGDHLSGSTTEGSNEDENEEGRDEEITCHEHMDIDDAPSSVSEHQDGIIAECLRSVSPGSDLVSEVLLDETDDDKTHYTPPPPKYKSHPPPKATEIPGLRASRLAAAAALHNQGWPKHCVDLFTKLQLRGLEPTLQHYLLDDFGVLPAALFTNPAIDPTGATAHIKPAGVLTGQLTSQSHFRHVLALEWLIKAGQRIRTCAEGKGSNGGEHWQRFAADMYHRWSLEDAGILWERMKRGAVPHNLALVELKTRAAHTAASMDAATVAALEKLEGQWIERLGEEVAVPPLYALVMTGTMVAVVALRQEWDADGDPAQHGRVDAEGSRLRPVATFDWGDGMMDVWNAFAVAITVVHCRDLLIETLIWNVLKPVDEPQGAFTVGAQVGGRYKEEDPDA